SPTIQTDSRPTAHAFAGTPVQGVQKLSQGACWLRAWFPSRSRRSLCQIRFHLCSHMSIFLCTGRNRTVVCLSAEREGAMNPRMYPCGSQWSFLSRSFLAFCFWDIHVVSLDLLYSGGKCREEVDTRGMSRAQLAVAATTA